MSSFTYAQIVRISTRVVRSGKFLFQSLYESHRINPGAAPASINGRLERWKRFQLKGFHSPGGRSRDFPRDSPSQSEPQNRVKCSDDYPGTALMGTLTITARAAEDPVGRKLRGCWTLVVDVENASRQCRTIASEGNAESTSTKLGAGMSKHST